MASNSALNLSSLAGKDSMRAYDEALLARFKEIIERRGYSIKQIASMLGKSTALVSQYINEKYNGDVAAVEQDIWSFIEREEQKASPYKRPDFCLTNISKKILAVLRAAELHQDMGVVVGPAGIGKTATLLQFRKKSRSSILVCADVTSRSVGAILDLISAQLPGCHRQGRNSTFLARIVEYLRDSRRLLVIDEAHFLSWESFEACRKLHDSAGIGVVFVGQPLIFDQMRGGRRAFMWDQLYSRIGVRCVLKEIGKDDSILLAETFCPGLNDGCLKYLHTEAAGKGKFRKMVKLLQRSMEIAKTEKTAITPQLLEEVKGLLGSENM
jgi:hypothetical protein